MKILRRAAAAYPSLLGELHDPPDPLYVRTASLELLRRPAVAIVGSRSGSGYGPLVARNLGRALATAGVVVVSGMAHGIDTAAHQGALEAGGATIAVLGCGIEFVYPVRNRALAQQIEQGGALVSEYPGTTPPARWRFPARNRLIAALCVATVVVEAAKGRGALITADFALETGREVFAVPGEITSARSAGVNGLIRSGAAPVTSIPELLEASV